MGSGSSGNCYLLYDSRGKCLILDVGLNLEKDIQPYLENNLKEVSGVIVTHDHKKDHTFSLKNCIKKGLDCYGNADICSKYKGCNLVECGKLYNIDGFRIQTFELVHNVPNNAFIIDTIDGIRVLYCTDTQYIPKRVKRVNYVLIEANNDDDVMISNSLNDKESHSKAQFHQSLDNCIKYLKSIHSPELMAVVLIHLSDQNSNAKLFVKKVQDELSFDNVYVADKGMVIELNKEEF